jgi:hypothetical protein
VEVERHNKNKNGVGNDRANDDASIEEIQRDIAAAVGLLEVPEAASGRQRNCWRRK